MSSQYHGRVCLAVALCLVTLFFILKIQHEGRTGAFEFTAQYYHSSRTPSSGIANDTLGFEKIFVINAPWRTDRKDSISLAASYGGISLEWVDGIDAEAIRESAYPPGNHRQINHGNLGSWRAHMDAMREVIVRNLTTALILEDDADWDFRLRSQLADFGHAARRLPELISRADAHAQRLPPASEQKIPDPIELAKRSSISLPSLGRRSIPKADPYGRDWDILWLGHCGAQLPPPSTAHPDRIMLLNDQTVAGPQHLKPSPGAPPDAISSIYPPYTRLVHRANATLCTLAYAVTQAGARKILYRFGIHDFSKGYDFALSDYCNGKLRYMTKETTPMCITVQPPLFSHFFGERGGSDITGTGSAGRQVGSRYIRQSVRGNLEGLVKEDEGISEQWGDEENKER